MRYPIMNNMASQTVNVPSLSGGVNLSDPLNLVDDNQMTEAKNLWYMDGNLKTRPAVKNCEREVASFKGHYKNNVFPAKLSEFIDGEKYTAFLGKNINVAYPNLRLNIVSGEKCIISAAGITNASDPNVSEAFFAGKPTLENGKGFYMLATTEKGYVKLYEVVDAEAAEAELQEITGDVDGKGLYTPTVYINGKMNMYSELPASEGEEYAAASFFEGYSAFSDAWAAYCYTSDGISSSLDLPVSFYGDTVYIEYNVLVGSEIKTYTFGPVVCNQIPTVSCNEDSKYAVGINGDLRHIIFWEKNPDYSEGDTQTPEYLNFVAPSALGVYANNITVKLKKSENTNTVLAGMKFGTWFGGSAGGINGGTRLFLSGSEKNKNLLAWSDLDNPTYFSENNYAYVGAATQRITALEKQSDMLVIFKENELFYTVYVEGESYSAKDVRDGKVIDVTTLSATFPMIQIHSELGCNIPSSIKLCGDRLVWACKDRHVYMLKSANQYSNCNISPISKMIDRALAKVTDDELNNAKACMYKGHYLLSFGTKTFVLNYDYYYFRNLPSYSDSNRAQKKLMWYLWELPEFDDKVYSWDYISTTDECYILVCHDNDSTGSVVAVHMFDDTVNYDSVQSLENKAYPIKSVLQTKLFDFGIPERFKKIEQVYMGFGEKTEKARIEYVTDRGRVDGGIVEIGGESDEYSPEYIKTKRFLPAVNRALKFGIRLESEGRIALDEILIKYKFMGVTR